jgi:hypothetical protein
LLDLDPFDQQGGIGVVHRAHGFVFHPWLQDNIANPIVDVRSGTRETETTAAVAAFPNRSGPET